MTYNQIIQRFEWWADGHPMLYHFTHGEFEISDLNRETAYPAIHVQPLSVRYGVQVRTYRFEVYIFELYRENGNEANEVREDLSDTLQIFEDLIAELRNGFDAFDRKKFLPVFPIEPTPFIQEHNGVLTGVQATIEIETSFLADACDSPVNPANPPSQLCPVGTITLNGVEFGTVASGGTLAGLVQYVNGTPVGSLVGEIWTIPNPAACDDVTITVNSEAYSTVASGGSDDIPVVNSAATPIGTVTPGGDVTIPDLDITVNGSAYGSTPATVDFDVDVVNSSRAPTGSLNAFGEWEVPAGAAPVGAILTKTGQTVSYRTGDDGDIQAGRDLSFVKLSGNNPFGHNWRITGTTGGYYDEDTSQYKTVDGTVVSGSGALFVVFPDRIAIDWAQFDGSTVLGYASPTLTPSSNTWEEAVDNALAYTVGAYVSGWRIGNWLEYANIMRSSHVSTWSWGYAPFLTSSLYYWTGTTSNIGTTQAMQVIADGRILYVAKTTNALRRYWPVRRFTVTGTTLS
jgi:hypothetical protein